MRTLFASWMIFFLVSVRALAGSTDNSQIDDIREAVFRSQFEYISRAPHHASAYYLMVGEKGRDPSGGFMKRFVDHTPPIRKASACSRSPGGVIDKETGEAGLSLQVAISKWKSPTEVVVIGDIFASGWSAVGFTYLVKKEKGKWRVVDKFVNWVS